MGNSITLIEQYRQKKTFSPLINSKFLDRHQFKLTVSLSRLQEFYGSFQSVCDNFCIDLTEFEQIFGANESSFIIWDTDNNGLIDAL